MKTRLSEHLVNKLLQIGQAIDDDRQLYVFEGGEVRVAQQSDQKEIDNESEGTRGPPAGSRKGAKPDHGGRPVRTHGSGAAGRRKCEFPA